SLRLRPLLQLRCGKLGLLRVRDHRVLATDDDDPRIFDSRILELADLQDLWKLLLRSQKNDKRCRHHPHYFVSFFGGPAAAVPSSLLSGNSRISPSRSRTTALSLISFKVHVSRRSPCRNMRPSTMAHLP